MEKKSKISERLHNDFFAVKMAVYDECGFEISDARPEVESKEYGACNFALNRKKIKFRVAKKTPTKTGQFVAIWKRNEGGATKPFDIFDEMDFMVITARSQSQFGQFVFPKLVLADKGIISQSNKKGKRGIRVYAPWDLAGSKQARQTQSWQINYFLPIRGDQATDFDLAAKLFSLTGNCV